MSYSNNDILDYNTLVTDERSRQKYESKKKKEALETFLWLAGLGGSAYAAAVMINHDPRLAQLLADKLPGAKRYARKHEQALNKYGHIPGLTPVDLTNQFNSPQTVGRSVLSSVLSVEELSPFGILKTLQTSNILEPLVGIDTPGEDIVFKGSALMAHRDYYHMMIKEGTDNKDGLKLNDFTHGFTIRDNKLYRNTASGIDLNQKVLDYVKPVTAYVQMGDVQSPNRILQQYAHTYGVSLGWNAFDIEQMSFIGGKSKTDVATRWGRAIGRQSMEVGFRTLDNPIAGIEEIIKATGAGNLGLFENEHYKKVRDFANINLGPGGQYQDGVRKLTWRTAKRLATVGVAGTFAYNAVNGMLDMVTPDSSIWNQGILEGITYNYTQARIGAAKILADPFQDYKEKQEFAAEGSTSLITLAGIPAAGAFFGASLPYFKRMYDSYKDGIETALDKSDAKTTGYLGLVKPITDRLKLQDTTLTKSFAVHGAIAGAVLALPFLPGALIGKSSEELEKEYTGEKLVANRKNRFWFSGSDHIEGGEIKNFQPSAIARLLSGGVDEVRYGGDDSLKRSLNPVYNPIGYLRNPYRYEELHTHDQPFPVWGMDVSYGSFLGKMFQGTVGEIIKPTVVNEEFRKQIHNESKSVQYNPRLSDNVASFTGEVLKGLAETNSDFEEYSGPYAGDTNIRHVPMATPGPAGSDAYNITYQAKPEEVYLTRRGFMLPRESPGIDQYEIAIGQTYGAITDFSGIKGFAGGLLLDKVGINPTDIRPQLERSGQAVNGANDFLDMNLGDVFSLGELQRRLLPSSSSSQLDYVNPMHNTVAPSWLPQDENRYYNDFSRGDFWSKVSHGEVRLPGEGYAALNRELKGVNPEDYPLVHQYKILSDVAPGSEEQISLRNQLFELRAKNKLSDEEEKLFFETLTYEQARASKKQFSEYKTSEDHAKMSLPMLGMSKLWETVTHNIESPLEPLTPIRPGAKLVHKRSAIEDYEMAQIRGTDNSIWTQPYDHFIKPTINNFSELLLPGRQTPSEAEDRDAFEEYFDKLEYVKARQNNRYNDALRTTHGITYAGILNQDDYNKFKRSLLSHQQPYVDSFARETDKYRRNDILEMVPTDVGRAYREIWKNLDVAEDAARKGKNVQEAIKENFVRDTEKYFGDIGDRYSDSLDTQVEKARQKRLKVADREAENIVSGVMKPSRGWIGWDPRLSMDEVKIRTLTVGKEDIHRHGYWESDVARNERILALDGAEVTTDYQRIVTRMRAERYQKAELESSLRSRGFEPRRIIFSPATENHLDMRLD